MKKPRSDECELYGLGRVSLRVEMTWLATVTANESVEVEPRTAVDGGIARDKREN